MNMTQRAVEVLGRLLLHDGPAPERPGRASRCRSGRGAWAWATGPASTRPASSAAPCPTAPGAIASTREEAACRKKKHHPCGIADGTNRPWTEGDEVNLAVGQGDLQATPLQMAVAYSALANGNHRVRPHLGAAVEDSGGRLLQRIEPGAAQHVDDRPGRAPGDPRRPARRHRPRHLGRRVEGLEPEPLPGVRQDRHRPARSTAPTTSRGTCASSTIPSTRSSSRSPSRTAASAPTPPPRWPARSSRSGSNQPIKYIAGKSKTF